MRSNTSVSIKKGLATEALFKFCSKYLELILKITWEQRLPILKAFTEVTKKPQGFFKSRECQEWHWWL